MTNEQYATRPDGRTVDLDIERVFEYLLDEDYTSDPLLTDVFYAIVKTYLKKEWGLRIRHDDRPPVSFLVKMELIRGLLLSMHIRYDFVMPDHPNVLDNQLTNEIADVKLFARIRTEFGWTHYVPGSSLGHALTLSIIQAARELSEMSLNPAGMAH